jgi:hypothetical protein
MYLITGFLLLFVTVDNPLPVFDRFLMFSVSLRHLLISDGKNTNPFLN